MLLALPVFALPVFVLLFQMPVLVLAVGIVKGKGRRR
jgi:hypothetical protein